MSPEDRQTIGQLIEGISLCAERDADTSDFVIWLACECAAINAVLRRVLEEAKEDEGPREQPVSLEWQVRQLRDQLDATTELTRKIRAVWVLWLTDARKGAIHPGTFDAMQNLLGMEKS